MKSKPPGALEVTLQPGDFYFGSSATRIKTLLGSCVSLTMWHPRLLIGGMCHYMLPSRPIRTGPLQGKYADEAFELFAGEARRHQTKLSDYHIKLFGGGHMFPDYSIGQGTTICEKNILAAREFLKQKNLELVSDDVGSVGHRTIIFDIWNGNVWVRHQPLAIPRSQS
jgi:chemotaxis protein CheD